VSLLPTPEAKLGSAGTDYARADREGSGGDDLQTATAKLFPTPRASDGEKGGPNQHGSSGDLMLPSAVMPLLPTPTAGNPADGADPEKWEEERAKLQEKGYNGNGRGTPLGVAIQLLPTPAAADGSGGRYGAEGHQTPLPGAVRLLPTPAVNDMGEGKTVEDWDGWTDDMKAKHGNGNGHGASLAIEAQRLLPTPSASDGEGGKTSRSGDRKDEPLLGAIDRLLPTPRVGADRTSRSAATRQDSMSAPSLGQAVEIAASELPREFESWDELPGSWQPADRLLPTPTAMDSEASGGSSPSDVTLTDATVRNVDRWGDYAPAIHRWEAILARAAPDPTQPSTKGNPQLAPRFVEWMMGLPAGHVTDVPGLTRNDMLKLLGNGVVWQQAYAALAWILRIPR
jgi:hypothetical protein